MKIIQKQLKLEDLDYYKVHLSIINSFLPTKLSKKEIEVLSIFMSFTGDIALDRFGATAKKIVKMKLGMSSAGLANYLKSMRQKGFLISKEKEIKILPILQPEDISQLYQFKLIKIT